MSWTIFAHRSDQGIVAEADISLCEAVMGVAQEEDGGVLDFRFCLLGVASTCLRPLGFIPLDYLPVSVCTSKVVSVPRFA